MDASVVTEQARTEAAGGSMFRHRAAYAAGQSCPARSRRAGASAATVSAAVSANAAGSRCARRAHRTRPARARRRRQGSIPRWRCRTPEAGTRVSIRARLAFRRRSSECSNRRNGSLPPAVPVLVRCAGFVFAVALEVRAGGVEEDQVDVELSRFAATKNTASRTARGHPRAPADPSPAGPGRVSAIAEAQPGMKAPAGPARSVAGHAVGRLAQDVDVAVVPRGLLDQVEQDPADRYSRVVPPAGPDRR
jgi:hypothetical protein